MHEKWSNYIDDYLVVYTIKYKNSNTQYSIKVTGDIFLLIFSILYRLSWLYLTYLYVTNPMQDFMSSQSIFTEWYTYFYWGKASEYFLHCCKLQTGGIRNLFLGAGDTVVRPHLSLILHKLWLHSDRPVPGYKQSERVIRAEWICLRGSGKWKSRPDDSVSDGFWSNPPSHCPSMQATQ